MRTTLLISLAGLWPAMLAAQAPAALTIGPWTIGASPAASGIAAAVCESQAMARTPRLVPFVVGTAELFPGLTHRSLARRTSICTVGAARLHVVRDTVYAAQVTLTGATEFREQAARWRDSLQSRYGTATAVTSAAWRVYLEREIVQCPNASTETYLFAPGPGRAVVLMAGCRPGTTEPLGLVAAVDSAFARGLVAPSPGTPTAQRPGYDLPFVGGGDAVIGGPLDTADRRSCMSLRPNSSSTQAAWAPSNLPDVLLPVTQPRANALRIPSWSAAVRAAAEATQLCSVRRGLYAFVAADTIYAMRGNYQMDSLGNAEVDAFLDGLTAAFGAPDSTVNVAGRWYLPEQVDGCLSTRVNTARYHHGPNGRQLQTVVVCRRVRVYDPRQPVGQSPELPRLVVMVTWIDSTRVPRPAAASSPAPARRATGTPPTRPVHTYSIVAMDSATGQLGVAVQSHWFSVGSVVSWAEPGVGAVATQSFILPSYGPRGLALMRTGMPAPQAMRALLAADGDSAMRQLGMIDAQGRAASFTGARNIPEAGSRTGRWYAAQANLMERSTVPAAMGRAFETARGDLAERLLAALEAAQREGGDIRGQQSAALIVVSGDRSLPPWDRVFDLRVEDHPRPVAELRRLVQVARAYRHATAGDDHLTAGRVDSALASYATAGTLLPDSAVNGELAYWHAVTLLDRGRVDESLPLFRRAFAQDARWATLLWRLPRVGLLSADSATIARVVREARGR